MNNQLAGLLNNKGCTVQTEKSLSKQTDELHNILMGQLFNTAQTKLTLQRAMMP